MNFGMIILKQGIKTMQNYVIWILTALIIQIKTKDFDKDFADYSKKKDLIHQIMNLITITKRNE